MLQNQLYHLLESKKNIIEIKKDIVNRLQLNYENLLYKQAYLQHEIYECKDVKTPNLIEIEKELNQKLGTIIYKDNLNKINEDAMLVIKQDEIDRIEMSDHLEELMKESELAVNRLDKKRKFNDEFIIKLEPIANAMHTQYAQFDAVKDQSDVDDTSARDDSDCRDYYNLSNTVSVDGSVYDSGSDIVSDDCS